MVPRIQTELAADGVLLLQAETGSTNFFLAGGHCSPARCLPAAGRVRVGSGVGAR